MHLRPSILTTLVLLILLQASAGAAEIDNILAEYEQGNTNAAFAHASALLQSSPDNATAWYILGNCHLKHHALQSAQEAFTRCLALKPQGQIATYASQAITALQLQTAQPPGSSAQQTPAPTDFDTSLRSTSAQSNLQQMQLSQDLQVRIREKERQRQERILKVQSESRQAIAAIPLYIYDADGNSYPNPDRPRLIAAIEADEARKVASISESCDKDEQAFRADNQQRVNALSDFANLTVVSSRTGSRNLQQTPHGTNLFVHNYVNFGLDEEEPRAVVPLRAKALPYNPSQQHRP